MPKILLRDVVIMEVQIPELTPEFLERFRNLPERIKQTVRKNYRLWKQSLRHPNVEFKN
ncbi:MAG: hypothetical protein P9F75_17315 [Candidatus Contendobacter sp.]|nr:hypothetical protein [Candidatus Contendobacter sp.]